MQQCPNAGIQRTPHHAVASVNANVAPVVRSSRLLPHQISRLRIVCPHTNAPLLHPRQFDSGLPINPLHVPGAVPSFEDRTTPDVPSPEAFLREPQDVLAELAQVACRSNGTRP